MAFVTLSLAAIGNRDDLCKTMKSEQSQAYDEPLLAVLELVWGEGYMSPGGPDEIKRIVDGVELAGVDVLDIGCGTGGITRFLAETYRPRRMLGIDIDPGLIERASKSFTGVEGLAFKTVLPGPLPFQSSSFDVVFSKDAMVHIEDKESLFADVHQVLRPNGMLAAGDWLSSTDGPYSPEMEHYLRLEGLGFGMASTSRYRAALAAAGFRDIQIVDRNAWCCELVRQEYKAMTGPLYGALVDRVGKEFADHEIDVWRAYMNVVEKGELRPVHLRARKVT